MKLLLKSFVFCTVLGSTTAVPRGTRLLRNEGDDHDLPNLEAARRRVETAHSSVFDDVGTLKSKKSKGGCLKFKWELEPVDGFEGTIEVEEGVSTSPAGYSEISTLAFDTAFEDLDKKIKSCDKDRCLDSEGIASMSMGFCLTPTTGEGGGNVIDTIKKMKFEFGNGKFEWEAGDDAVGDLDSAPCCQVRKSNDLEDRIEIGCRANND